VEGGRSKLQRFDYKAVTLRTKLAMHNISFLLSYVTSYFLVKANQERG